MGKAANCTIFIHKTVVMTRLDKPSGCRAAVNYDTIANDDSGPPPPSAIIPNSGCSCTGNRQLSSTNPGNKSGARSGFSDAQVRYNKYRVAT